MGVLNRDTRRQLREILAALAGFDTRDSRTVLLHDLPPRLVGQIMRSDAALLDLDAIIDTCDLWAPDAATADPYPLRLLIENALDLAQGSQAAAPLQALLDTLPARLDPQDQATIRRTCPYPGMIPFRPEDARFFYGREGEIREMLQRLRQQRFFLVVGPSGSGKSSLIVAGLLPQLHDSPYWPPGFWQVQTLRPGALPTEELQAHLGGDPTQPAQTVAALLAAHPPAQRLLLVVDQLEEVFTLADRNEQSRFISALTGLRALDNCALLLSMRADFYPDLMGSTMWPLDMGARLELAPLHGAALRSAIREPAAAVGVEIDPALVERLLADAAGEPGSLPLLQETLVLLWGQMAGRILTLSSYETLGRAGQSGLAVAIANKADATFALLTPAQQVIARRIFLRLVQFGEGRSNTRRQQPLAALQAVSDDPAQFAATLRVLTDNRLLTLSGEGAQALDRTVDISHEALIRGWPLLQIWLTEQRAAEETRRRLEDKAIEWVRLGRAEGGLLDAAELPEADRWLASAPAQDLGTSANLAALTAASRAALQQAEDAREAIRQRELAQAQALATEQRARADEQARAARRLRRGAVLLALLAVLALVAAGAALLEGNQASQAQARAEQRERAARAEALAGHALEHLNQDPERSVLLAREAVSITQAWQEPVATGVEDALRQAVTALRLRRTLPTAPSALLSGAYRPDGRLIAAAGQDGSVQIWDATTGQPAQRLPGQGVPVRTVAWSPDGRFLLTASDDKTAQIWDLAPGAAPPPRLLIGHSGAVASAAWSPNGQRIVTAGLDGTIRTWDAQTGSPLQSFRPPAEVISPDPLAQIAPACQPQPGEAVHSAVWSPDGRFVAAAHGCIAEIWDPTTGQVLRSFVGHTHPVLWVSYSPHGDRLLTTSEDGTGRVWDAATGRYLFALRGHRLIVQQGVYSPDGTQIATAGYDGTARVWDAATGEEFFILWGHTEVVTSVAYAADSRSLLTTSWDQTARVWDTTRGFTVAGQNEVWSAALSPDGQHIATGGTDQVVRVWDMNAISLTMTLHGHTDLVRSVSYSPDGRQILSASHDGTAILWDAATGQRLHTLSGHTDAIENAVWSRDGQWIATAGKDHTARIWEAASGHLLHTLPPQPDALFSVAFSPQRDFLVTGSAGVNAVATIWNTATWQPAQTLRGHGNTINAVQYSPDGQSIVTASDDRTVRVWTAATGQEQVARRMDEHTREVYSAVWSPDGQEILTASKDGTARIWTAATGEERVVLRGHKNWVTDAVYSVNGQYIVTTSADGTARLHRAALSDVLALARAQVTRSLTPEERALFLGEPLPPSENR